MEKRERSVNVENLSEEQVANIAEQIGGKLSEIINRAVEEARIITKIYGIDVKFAYQLEPLKKDNESN